MKANIISVAYLLLVYSKLAQVVKTSVRAHRGFTVYYRICWPDATKKLLMQCPRKQDTKLVRGCLPPSLPHLWSAHTLRPTLPWCEVHMNSPVGDTVTPVTAFLNHIQSTILPVGRSHILIKNDINIFQRTHTKARHNKHNNRTHSKTRHSKGAGDVQRR